MKLFKMEDGQNQLLKPEPRTHKVWKMILVIANFIALAVTMLFNYASSPALTIPGLYKSDTGNISDKYDTLVTPSSGTFTIWAFIYIYQIVLHIYHLTLLCRKTDDGHYLYVYPGHISVPFFILYIINMGLNTSWIFLFDREQLIASFIFLFLIAISIYFLAGLVCRGLHLTGAELESTGQTKDIWLTRFITLNALAMYGTWCTIATLLNLSIVLQYRASVNMYTCAWLSLGILTAVIITWFILETFVLDRHLRYCFMPYVVLLVALTGILSKYYRPEQPETYLYYVMFLIALSAVFGAVKLVVMILKSFRCPITYSNLIIPSTLTKEQEAARITA